MGGYVTRDGIQINFIFSCFYLLLPPVPLHLLIVEGFAGGAAEHVLDCRRIIVVRIFLFVETGFSIVFWIEIEYASAIVGVAVWVVALGPFTIGKVVCRVCLIPC